MNRWVKIENQHFNVTNISVQYNITEHQINWRNTYKTVTGPSSCDITVVFNISDSKSIFPLFDNRKKFDMTSSDLVANGCYIKTIDMDITNNTLVADITSDYVKLKDISDIRDEKINQILDETSDKNNNIK